MRSRNVPMILALAALVLSGLLALPSLRFHPNRQSSQAVAANSEAPPRSRGLDSAPALHPAPRESAWPVAAEENDRTRALTTAINAALEALGNQPAAMGPARPIPDAAPNALGHRGAAPTPEQTRALARLRWNSPGKPSTGAPPPTSPSSATSPARASNPPPPPRTRDFPSPPPPPGISSA